MNLFERCWTKENERFVRSVLLKLDDDPHKDAIFKLLTDRVNNIWLTLAYLAKLTKPERYLEVGVRRGFSMALVATRCKKASLQGIDLWIPNYANTDNPGPEFVKNQLALTGHTGNVELISGDSHDILPTLVGSTFNLILIDGDHRTEGVYQDIMAGLKLLAPGGYLVVDDLQDKAVLAGWQQACDKSGLWRLSADRVGVFHNGS